MTETTTLTVAQVAQYLNCDQRTVRSMVLRETISALKGLLSLGGVASVVGAFLWSWASSGWSVAVGELITAGLVGLATGAVFVGVTLAVNVARAPLLLASKAHTAHEELKLEVAPLLERRDRQATLDELARKREVGVALFVDREGVPAGRLRERPPLEDTGSKVRAALFWRRWP